MSLQHLVPQLVDSTKVQVPMVRRMLEEASLRLQGDDLRGVFEDFCCLLSFLSNKKNLVGGFQPS